MIHSLNDNSVCSIDAFEFIDLFEELQEELGEKLSIGDALWVGF